MREGNVGTMPTLPLRRNVKDRMRPCVMVRNASLLGRANVVNNYLNFRLCNAQHPFPLQCNRPRGIFRQAGGLILSLQSRVPHRQPLHPNFQEAKGLPGRGKNQARIEDGVELAGQFGAIFAQFARRLAAGRLSA